MNILGGRTAHSRFKIPFKLQSNSTCNIDVQSEEAKLLIKAAIIIWDEAPMAHKHGFEALDRTLRDIMGQVDPILRHIPFGNKLIVFGGDFRQILPVVKKGTRNTTVLAAINQSKLWSYVKILSLTINMRIQAMRQADATSAQQFSDLLLKIGNGNIQNFT